MESLSTPLRPTFCPNGCRDRLTKAFNCKKGAGPCNIDRSGVDHQVYSICQRKVAINHKQLCYSKKPGVQADGSCNTIKD